MKSYIDAILYILITAIGFVYLDHIYNTANKLTILFIMLCGAIIWFNLINIKRLRNIYQAILNNKILYIAMSLLLAIDWFCSLYGVAYADPFVYLSVLFISLALSGYIDKLINKQKISLLQFISLAVLSISIILLLFFYKGRVLMIIGILLAILCGITFYGYSITSIKLLQKCNLSTSEILATRFWLVLFITVILMPKSEFTTLTVSQVINYLGVGFLTMIIPIYNYQQSLKKIGSSKTAIILCFTPVITYLIFAIYNNLFNFSNLTISILIAIAMLFEYTKPVLNYLKKSHNSCNTKTQ